MCYLSVLMKYEKDDQGIKIEENSFFQALEISLKVSRQLFLQLNAIEAVVLCHDCLLYEVADI
jgi:hypothetical protein